ncbi:phage head-binding domain-containing protein [Citrobacter freundii]
MSDITANIVIGMPSQLFTMPRSFKAVANGKIYIGQIDTDPVNPANQIPVYLENENGSHVQVAQPIVINAGGYPVYNGQIAKFVTVQGHSMAVYDASNAQQFYYPNVLKYDPDQLRSDLASPSGGGLVSLSQGGTVQDAIRWVDPAMFGAHAITEPGYENFDSSVAFQEAIDYAEAHNISTVRFQGRYLLATAQHTFTLPRDDGTVYPGWVGSGDSNITAEPVITMPVCLKISSRIALIANNPEKDNLIGPWNVNSGAINTSQLIGILVTAGSQYQGSIRYTLKDFSVEGFMIGRVVEGTAEASVEQLKFVGCGIAGIIQGVERRHEGQMQYTGCLSGDVHGGWWTQRNDTRGNTTYLPPYPATDVWSLGWTDYCQTDAITYGQGGSVYGAQQQSMDAFFDTYFFKSSNSAKTSLGGRLSNNADPANPAVLAVYRGVVGRARTVFSRYGRSISNYSISNLKTLGCHRTPVWYSPGAGAGVVCSRVDDAYIERSGLIDNTTNSTTGNRFGIDNTDPYRAPGYGIGYTASYGPMLGALNMSSGNQQADACDAPGILLAGPINISKVRYTGGEDGTPYFEDYVLFGSSFVRKYRKHEDWFFTQPLRFGSESGEDFSYTGTTTFTPALVSGGVAVTPSSVNGRYKKVGNVVYFKIVLFNGSALSIPNGAVAITGLPLPINTGTSANAFDVSVNYFNTLNTGLNVKGRISGTNINLVTDSAGTSLNGSQCNASTGSFSIEISGWYFI